MRLSIWFALGVGVATWGHPARAAETSATGAATPPGPASEPAATAPAAPAPPSETPATPAPAPATPAAPAPAPATPASPDPVSTEPAPAAPAPPEPVPTEPAPAAPPPPTAVPEPAAPAAEPVPAADAPTLPPVAPAAPTDRAAGQAPAPPVARPSVLGDPVLPGVRAKVGGFADVGVEGTQNLEAVDFRIGQLVGHANVLMPKNLSVFTEVTLNSYPTWETRVERLLISWEQGDFLKLSFGRHHLPVTWWNSTFHHGLWLQTSARRPLMIGYSDAFVPNHAIGLVGEGFVPGARRVGLRYHLALSGGGDDHRHTAETYTENPRFAGTAGLFLEPPALSRLRIGAVMYADPHRMRDDVRVAETLIGGHLAYTTERPEMIAEYVAAIHDADGARRTYWSDAAYAQLGWRFRGAGDRFKPYVRVEQMRIDPADPTLADRSSQQLATLGLRVDVADQLAVKLEGAWRALAETDPAAEALVQVSAAW